MNDTLQRLPGYIVSLVALLLLIAYWKWDLRLDGPSAVLLVLAAAPWLRHVFKAIELPGFKLELQEMKKELEETKGAAISAAQRSELAIAGAEAPPAAAAENPDDRLAELAARYNFIRRTQVSGSTRTAAMTAIIGEMMRLAPSLKMFDPRRALLQQEDRGVRLAAYAYLHARPDAELLPDLVRSFTEIEDKPFAQYWAIMALRRILQKSNGRMPDELVQRLRAFAAALAPGTDRRYELDRLLAELRT